MATLGATGVTLIDQILNNPEARAAAEAVVPERYRPSTSLGAGGMGAEDIPTFAQVDFGLVRDADGSLKPKLVELQAFASLYGFQLAVAEAYRDAFGLPASLDLFLDGLTPDRYHSLVADAIVGDHDPAEVVLMEIQPRQQKTWPDFVVTEQMWGVRAVDTAEVTREGRRLYYRRDGKVTQIKRIYNRVIPDELERKRHPAVVRIRRRPRRAMGRASGVVFPPEQVLDSLAQRTRPFRKHVSSTASSSCRSIANAICSSRCSHSRAAASCSRPPTRRLPPFRMRSARTTSCRSALPSSR